MNNEIVNEFSNYLKENLSVQQIKELKEAVKKGEQWVHLFCLNKGISIESISAAIKIVLKK